MKAGLDAANGRFSGTVEGTLNTGGGSGRGSTNGVNLAAGALKTGGGALVFGGSVKMSRRANGAASEVDATGAENTAENTVFSPTDAFGAVDVLAGAWNIGGGGSVVCARDTAGVVVVVGVFAARARRLTSGVWEVGLTWCSSSLNISNCMTLTYRERYHW